MQLTVFGATGGVGRQVVRQALAAGHSVTAVVRDPARLTETGERLEVVRSNLADPAQVREAVAGSDAVLSGLGPRSRAEAGVATRLTRTILHAMHDASIDRIVVVSAAPVGPPSDDSPLDRAFRFVIGRVLTHVYDDLRSMETSLADASLRWTSVRPPRLTDRPLTGRYRRVVGGSPRNGRLMGRADVAHAMLAAIDDPATYAQGVGVAY